MIMVNFLMFMMVSVVEFFALMLLILSVFNFNIAAHRKEIILTAVIMSLLSYLLTIFNLNNVIPLPLIEIPVLIYLFIRVFKRKPLYSVITVIVGFLLLGAIEYGVVLLGVLMKYIVVSEIQEGFSQKGYALLTISSIVVITISIYIKTCVGGFGFMLRTTKAKVFSFLYSTIAALFFSCIILYTLIRSQSLSMIVTLLISLVVSSIVVIYLSNKRDQAEFS